MSIETTFNGTAYQLPDIGESGWGTDTTNFMVDVGNNAATLATAQTLSNKTLASPIFTGTATGPFRITEVDSGSAVDLVLSVDGQDAIVVQHVSNLVNALSVTGGATGTGVTLAPVGTDTNVDLVLDTQGAGELVLMTGGSAQVTINTTGVGIGDITPSYALDVSGDVQIQGGSLRFDTTGSIYTNGSERLSISSVGLMTLNSTLQLNAASITQTDASGLTLSASHASGTIIASTAGSERLRITSAGLVGIGITPSSTLEVNGITTFSSGGTTRGKIDYDGGDNVLRMQTVAGAGGIDFVINGSAFGRNLKLSTALSRFYTDVRVDDNLFINTSSNLVTANDQIAISVASGAGIGVKATSTAGALALWQAEDNSSARTLIEWFGRTGASLNGSHKIGTDDSYQIITGSGIDIAFLAGSTERLRIDSTTGVVQYAQAYDEKYKAWGNSSTSLTVDFDDAQVHGVTLTGNCTFTFDGAAAANQSKGVVLVLTQDGVGGRTVTWPASVKWAGGSAPTVSSSIGDIDVFTFFSPDQGTTWYGFTAGQGMD